MSVWYSALPAIIRSPAPVTIITAPEYPSLFITWLLTTFKQQHNVLTLEVSESTIADLAAQLGSSFLGSSSIYWLRDLHVLDATAYKQCMQLVSSYTGPHKILFFLPTDERRTLPPSMTVLALPERLTMDDLVQLAQLQEISLQPGAMRNLIQQLFQTYQTISLEQAMLMLNYLPLVGRSAAEFMHEWVPRLMTSDQSLFGLSQAFFAKNIEQTMLLWHQMRDQYSDQFWTAYWSEQLFRAYFVAKALQTRDTTIDLRRLSARLPFSFIKRDWKRWQLDELAAAHVYITRLELDLKNGATSWQLDAFYFKIITL